jgi:hypothetical protein
MYRGNWSQRELKIRAGKGLRGLGGAEGFSRM